MPPNSLFQDLSDLGSGYSLVIESSHKIFARLFKDRQEVWHSSLYTDFTEANAVTIGEELKKAQILPPELEFQNKKLIPILADARNMYLERACEDPLEFIDQAVEKTVKHDKMHRRLVLLGMISAFCVSPLNVTFKAETTTGKSWIMTQIATFLPNEDVLIYCDASPTAFYHKFGKIMCKEHGEKCPPDTRCRAEKYKLLSFKRKILLFLDQPNDLLLQHMKPLLSHDQKELIRLATDANKKGPTKAMEVHLEGWPSLCYASCKQDTDPEIASRAFIISPDDSAEKIHAVLRFQALQAKDPMQWKTEYESDLAVVTAKQMVRDMKEFVEKYRIEIEKPYIEELEARFKARFPTCPRSMRAFPQLLSLVDAVTLLNYRKRSKTEFGERSLKLTSKIEDANVAFEILEYFLDGLKYGLSTAVTDAYSRIIRPLITEKGPVTSRDVVLCFRIAKGRYISERSVRRNYLEPLVDRGLLNTDVHPTDKRRTLYSLNEEEKKVDQWGQGTHQCVKMDVRKQKIHAHPYPLGSIFFPTISDPDTEQNPQKGEKRLVTRSHASGKVDCGDIEYSI